MPIDALHSRSILRRGSSSATHGGAKGNVVDFEARISGCDKATAKQRLAKLLKVESTSTSAAVGSQIVATYGYHDEKGNLLYEQVRFEPKGFAFRRPDGAGGWVWNLRGVPRVLYRLPEVIAAERVFVAEGEKDVETIRSWGPVATCNPGGAGKWRPEYSRLLVDKRIVVLQDNDEPGRKHAEQVAASVAQYCG
jgi:hypothetical protein